MHDTKSQLHGSLHHRAPNSMTPFPIRIPPELVAVATAPILWAAFFPLNLGFCAWLGLVPLLVLTRSEITTRRAVLAAWGIGIVHFWLALKWTRVAHPMMYMTWFALGLYCGLYFGLGVFLIRRLRTWPMTLALPVVWCSLEFLRAHLMSGFAWYFLGHTQHDYLAMIQIADLGGVYAVSFVVAAVNGLLFDLITRWPLFRGMMGIAAPTVSGRAGILWASGVTVLLGATITYGIWRSQQTDFDTGPQLTLLQSNIDQGTRVARNDGGDSAMAAQDVMLQHVANLTMESRDSATDLMVWPETTCPREEIDIAPDAPEASLPEQLREVQLYHRDLFADIARKSRTNVLLGLNCESYTSRARPDRFNSALMVDRNGHIRGRYDKMHCVPFGEYVPFRETIPWMRIFSPYETDYSLTPGERWTRFELPAGARTWRFGVIICYEDSDPLLARRYSRDEGPDRPPVDFLINISNDGWFDGTEEHEQHLAICRFRAIEARRSIARAVNMGISAVIDGNGRVVALPGETWAASKKISGVVKARVPIDHRHSIYARLGDSFAAICAAGLTLGLAWSFYTKRRNHIDGRTTGA